MKLILASRSPRRRELLDTIGLSYELLPAEGEESAPAGLEPEALVARLAMQKAAEVAAKRPDALVLGADTVVELDGRILGKPRDAADAADMLRALSGRMHRVHTGVALVGGGRTLTGTETSRVFFRRLTEAEIEAYVRSGEPLDKAGAYGIQQLGSLLVSRIEGDYFNIVGLPLCLLRELLLAFGIDPLTQTF